jgi:hypothetical protein
MYEFTLPPSESWPFILEDLCIPYQPNIPACNHNNLHEERLTESLPRCSNHHLQIIMLVVPNSRAKIALKK